jgi:hypothetical protein
LSDNVTPPNLLNLADFVLNEYTKAQIKIQRSPKEQKSARKSNGMLKLETNNTKQRKKKVTAKNEERSSNGNLKNRDTIKTIISKKKTKTIYKKTRVLKKKK